MFLRYIDIFKSVKKATDRTVGKKNWCHLEPISKVRYTNSIYFTVTREHKIFFILKHPINNLSQSI